ncbi:MAG: peptidase P60 [Rhizobiaceae bacterium]|nr:peptidase P60 [Rhizobiaceae bacterium]
MMNSSPLDRRLNAYRADLANIELTDRVEAASYVSGQAARVVAHFADVYDQPDSAVLQTQFLHGHEVTIFERKNGWAWVQGKSDQYVGYVRDETLTREGESLISPNHMVAAPRTFIYSNADLKLPRIGYLSVGSNVKVIDQTTTRGTDYSMLDGGGAVVSRHLMKIGDWNDDPVEVAETLLHTPYLWGGSTGFGIDCSGLVWLSQMLCGKRVLRDTDQQANSIGQEIALDFGRLQRGDLVFWKGHVGMMADSENLLHANGNSMDVSLEPLNAAVERIGYLYQQPTMARRP